MARSNHPSFFAAHPNVPRPDPASVDRSLTGGYAVCVRRLERLADEQRRRLAKAKADAAEAGRWTRELEREIRKANQT
jgi:hypothetical protein